MTSKLVQITSQPTARNTKEKFAQQCRNQQEGTRWRMPGKRKFFIHVRGRFARRSCALQCHTGTRAKSACWYGCVLAGYPGLRTRHFAGLVHYSAIPVQKALSGTVSCTNRAYARDTSRGLRVLCTSPAYARDRLVRDRRLQNSGFYTRQAYAQVRLMHATLR